MVFSSSIFLFLFLPLALLGYYLIRVDLRNVFLLVVSLLFYTWGEPKFVLLMITSIVINYVMGLIIGGLEQSKLIWRRIALLIAILANLGILSYFKYFDFFISNVNAIAGTQFSFKNIALPIGISFFTFQGLSYIFDLYMRKIKAQKNFVNIALYIALFPSIMAGPINRYTDINPQINQRSSDLNQFAEGVKRFIVGLSKKIILSNTFAVIADRAFEAQSSDLTVSLAWIGIIAYTIQIYFDFSGYSDMAIGIGKMFGFKFLENFNYPYISKNLTEFWRRWHISLSSWFRDYVYIPLGGNRKGNVYLNLLIVFFLTGMWHGASWNFIVWGLWHGLFLIIERVFKQKGIKVKVPSAIKWIYMIIVVMIGWVLFRAASLTEATSYIRAMFGLTEITLINSTAILFLKENLIIFIIAVLGSMPVALKLRHICNTYALPNKLAKVASPIFYIILFTISIAYTVTSSYNPFIYFNF